MSDITMCMGQETPIKSIKGYELELGTKFICPLRDSCYRYKAKPNGKYQSWFINLPYNKVDGDCDRYWEVEQT